MTLIIASRDGWMVADRRLTFQDTLIGPYVVNKIQRGPGVLVATSGSGELMDLVARALAGATLSSARSSVQDIFLGQPGNGRPGHALVLQQSPRGICEISSRGSITFLREEVEFWAIGSGFPVAMGYLTAEARNGHRIGPSHAQAAIEYAATLFNDVGDGVQVERL